MKFTCKDYFQIEKPGINITGFNHIHNLHTIDFIVLMESEMKSIGDVLKPHRGQVYQ